MNINPNIDPQSTVQKPDVDKPQAQQIQTGTPDDLYDWSGMTHEKLKELLS